MVATIIENPKYRDRICVFRDRFDAGKVLADALNEYVGNQGVIVLAIPAGGVPVGYVIAKTLRVPMDISVTRKVQIPWSPEAGFGAVGWDGKVILNEKLVKQLNLTETEQGEAILAAKRNVEQRRLKFKSSQKLPDFSGKIVILVDDGLASGFTMLVAVRSACEKAAKEVIVAVPTASLGAVELLASEVDKIVCPNIRGGVSFAVADAYEYWYDLTDEEVIVLLTNQHSVA
jgi:predicted phosphoribosyltransferase